MLESFYDPRNTLDRRHAGTLFAGDQPDAAKILTDEQSYQVYNDRLGCDYPFFKRVQQHAQDDREHIKWKAVGFHGDVQTMQLQKDSKKSLRRPALIFTVCMIAALVYFNVLE